MLGVTEAALFLRTVAAAGGAQAADYVDIREIDKLGRAAVDTNELFIEGLPVSKHSLIGEEGNGLKYLFHGLNAERVFVAAVYPD